MKHPGITIGNIKVPGGSRQTIEIPMASLYSHAPMSLPVQVVCGKSHGPRVFVSAAIHGDEINGVEIIRRLLRSPAIKKLHGTLIAVPVVNVYGFVNRSRYLPDRRDLNRSFPGSHKGSMAARLADLFLKEIVDNSDFGIDLHTAASHRDNLPQIRANMDDAKTAEIARAFDVPVIINSDLRDGSLRQIATEQGIPMLLYEAGEALRFDERAIRAGLRGIVSVMRHIGMLRQSRRKKGAAEPLVARSTAWVRAAQSGILRTVSALGARVGKGDIIGVISDPFGEQEINVTAAASGIIIGRTNLPLVNEGEGIFHIARFDSVQDAENIIEAFQSDEDIHDSSLMEEPPIV